MGRQSGYRKGLLVLAAACFCAAVPGGALAESGRGEACAPEDEEKDGLCGHALAAIARIEMEADRPVRIAGVQDAMEDTDITHVFLDLEVTLSPNPANNLIASNTLDVTSKTNGLTQFTLDLYHNMNVSAVLLNGAAAGFTRPGNQTVIQLDRPYNLDETFQVKVFYNGLPDSSGSMDSAAFTFKTHSTGGQARTIVSSLSQPFYAHRWWPCKESTSDKFTMDMWVTTPSWMVVASNGTLQGTDTLSGSRKRTRWRENHPIVTYLVSVAMTNYNKTTWFYNHPGGSMPVELYLYPQTEATDLNTIANCQGMQSPLPCLVQMIATLSDPGCFGEYPFIDEKYGIAKFQTNFGLEHQTITSQGNFVERRTLHELAHSWWGNSVTCRTWHHIWLNEGFARYAESLWHEKKPGGSYSAYLDHMNAFRPGTSVTGTVYRYDISTTSAIFSSTYAYNKGSWVMHMLRHVVGDTAFFGALADYHAAHAGGMADTEDFQAAVEAASGMDLNWFFQQWIYNPGAPYYRYGWEPEQIDGQHYVRLHVEQYQHTLPTPLPLMKMPIDITLTTASGSQTHVVWADKEIEWYLLPADGPVTGLQFDKDTWILRGAATLVPYAPGPPIVIRTDPLPGWWSLGPGPDRIDVQFNEAVTFAPAHFTVTGSRAGEQPLSTTYDSSSYTVTLHLPGPLPSGQTWTVRVSDEVRSAAGNVRLDGEIDPDNPFPSGDGIPGGDAEFSFYLAFLGDLNQDGYVDSNDAAIFSGCATGANIPQEDPDCVLADLDGDGDVDQEDFAILQRCFGGLALPPPDCG